jgi:hypothetical protein
MENTGGNKSFSLDRSSRWSRLNSTQSTGHGHSRRAHCHDRSEHGQDQGFTVHDRNGEKKCKGEQPMAKVEQYSMYIKRGIYVLHKRSALSRVYYAWSRLDIAWPR